MPHYFFHILDGKAVLDDVGTELADMDQVRAEAIRSAGQMLSKGTQSWSGNAWQMVVCDEAGTVVFSVNFSVDRQGL